MTIFVTGTKNISPVLQYNWRVVSPIVGTSFTYDYSVAGLRLFRSNATVAMSDTLPALVTSADNEPASLWNGWYVQVKNTDASASLTITPPTGILLNGSSSAITLTAGQATEIYFDGTNYYTWLPNV